MMKNWLFALFGSDCAPLPPWRSKCAELRELPPARRAVWKSCRCRCPSGTALRHETPITRWNGLHSYTPGEPRLHPSHSLVRSGNNWITTRRPSCPGRISFCSRASPASSGFAHEDSRHGGFAYKAASSCVYAANSPFRLALAGGQMLARGPCVLSSVSGGTKLRDVAALLAISLTRREAMNWCRVRWPSGQTSRCSPDQSR